MILLDTNICIAFLNGSDDSVFGRLKSLSPGEVALCSIVKAELLFGARKSTKVDQNLTRLNTFFKSMASLDFDDRAAVHYGIVRTQLEAAGTPIGANNLLIASIALANDIALATRNINEFVRVPGLRLAKW